MEYAANQYVVVTPKGVWQAGYSKELGQQAAFDQARQTARHEKVRGRVIDTDTGKTVFNDRD